MKRALGVAGLVLAATAALAQSNKLSVREAARTLDLSVPDSPAFTLLGISPETIARPTSFRSLSVSVLNSLDPDRDLALECSLSNLLRGTQQMTLAQYRSDARARLLRNTQFTLAKARSAQPPGAPSTRLALGLHTLLTRDGDPLRSARYDRAFQDLAKRQQDALDRQEEEIDRLQEEIDRLRATETLPGRDRKLAEARAALTRAEEEKRTLTLGFPEKVRRAYQALGPEIEAAPKLQIAAAPCFVDSPEAPNQYRWDGYGAWASYSFGGKVDLPAEGGAFNGSWNSQFIAHVRVRAGERAGATATRETTLAGLRWRAGGPELKFSLEATSVRTKRSSGGTKNDTLLGLVLEPRLSEAVWASVSVQRDTREAGTSGLRASLKYGFL